MQGGGAKNNGGNGGSYVVATIFLVFMVIIVLILFFSVLKPRDPTISVNAVEVRSIAVEELKVNANVKVNVNVNVNLSMSIYFSVNNPNRAAFNYYDSSVQLMSLSHAHAHAHGHGHAHARQIALISLPAGNIRSGNTLIVATTLIADPFRSSLHSHSNATSSIYVRVQSKIRMIGRVNVLYFFTHHVEASARCNNNIAVINGALLSFHC